MENYIVSARKYRPSTFNNVVGQKSLTTTLKNAILNNKLAHAYLFSGPRGVGKTSCARIFAKTINCLKLTSGGEACNDCESCISFNEQRSLNIHELDAASNNSVDDIRTLIDQVRIPPQLGKYKVYIIDEVHMLSQQAFNAFLKTLEEPPKYAIFILATTEKQKVLATILSRCQIYDFTRISIADMVEHLQYVASNENITAEPEALNVIAQKADGGLRDALSIFDQVASYAGGSISYQSVIENLNVLDYEYHFRITDALLQGEIRSCLLLLNEILEKGFDGQHFITGLAAHFRDLLVCRDESTLVLLEVGASIRDRYRTMAKQCPEQLLFKAIELANQCDLDYRDSRNKRLLLELTLIQLCQIREAGQITPDDKKKMINPIPDLLSSTKTAGQPPAPTSTSAKQHPAPETPRFSDANNTQAKDATASIPANLSRTLKTTSIKSLIKEPEPEIQPTTHETQQQSTPFNENDLIKYWDAFSKTIEEKAHLKNTMINCKPVLLDNFKFEVRVHNPTQKEELLNSKLGLLKSLRTQLKNDMIQMSVHVDEKMGKKIAYTSAEKFELLNKINPLLSKLVDEFDLAVD